MPCIDYKTRDAWLEARRALVTASEAAIICSKIKTPYKDRVSLWAEKMGYVEPPEASPLMKAGIMKEPHIAEIYTELYGEALINRGDYAIHIDPEIPWLAATVDRERASDGIPVEIKNVGAFNQERWQHGAAPLPYECQLQIQIHVLRKDSGILFCEIGGNEWQKREYKYNPNFIQALMPELVAFHECLESDTEPEYDFWSEAVTTTFENLHPNDNGSTVYMDDIQDEAGEYRDLLERRLALNKKAREFEPREKELQTIIKGRIGDHTYGVAGAIRFALKTRADNKRMLKIL